MELLYNFFSIFLDSFTGLMPYFLLGLMASALVEVFLEIDKLKIMRQNRVKFLLVLALAAIFLPVAKGGILPLVRRLHQKGIPLYMVLFLLTAAPVVNFLTFENTIVAFGWVNLVWLRFGAGWLLACLTALLFFVVKSEPPAPSPKCDEDWDVNPHPRWNRFLHTLLSDCFEWLPFFIGGSLLAAGLRMSLPLADWMGTAAGAPQQVSAAMLYGMTLSISSTVDCFVALNWLGRFPVSAVLAFLMAGSIVDIRGLVMMARGFGLKTSLYWAAWVLILVLIGAMWIQLGIKG